MIFLGEKYLKTGIYKIENQINKKCYIGSTIGLFKNRYFAHKTKLDNNKHYNNHLQNSYNKYGRENFVFSILEQCEIKECIKREQYYIDLFKPDYNILKTAGSFLGYKHTKEAKKKISESFTGKNHPAYSGEYVFYNKFIGYVIDGIVSMSKKFNLTAVDRLCRDELSQHHGWICLGKWSTDFKYPNDIINIYQLKTDNKPYYAFYHKKYGKYINHIKEFCQKHNLKRMNIKRLIKSVNGDVSSNGWICFGKQKKDYIFPKNINEIYNITMNKNYRIKNTKNIKSKFINNGKIFEGTIEEFSKKYNLHLRCVIRLYNEGRRQYKGWSILK